MSDTEQTAFPATPIRNAVADTIDMLRRRFVIILGCVVVAAVIAIALTLTAQKLYSASSALLFRESPPAATSPIGSAQNAASSSSNPLVDQATNVQLVGLDTVDQLTASALGNGISAKQVRRWVSIGPAANSNVVTVTATTPSPNLSARIANTFAKSFVAFRRQVDSAAILAAKKQALQLLAQLSTTQRDGSTGRSLEAQAQDLSLLASLQGGNAQVVQTAIPPDSPSSPKKARNVILSVLAGLVVGLLAALVAERLDRRIRSVEELGAVLPYPVLAAIPRSAALDTARTTVSRPTDLEPFQLLRAHLHGRGAGSGSAPTFLTTSAQPGDGKSTISTFLAAAAAVAGTRVLLIDADLRRPGRIAAPRGLTQVLAGKAEVADVIQSIPVPVASVESISFDALPSGPLRANPAALLSSDRLEDVFAYCQERYELIVMDGAPLTVVSDSASLLPFATGVLAVVRIGRSERPALRRLNETLRLLDTTVTGVVANAVETHSGYGYGYGYDDGYIDVADAENGAERSEQANGRRNGEAAPALLYKPPPPA